MKPSEAFRKGICPSCLGEKSVLRAIELPGDVKVAPQTYRGVCSTCGGSGKWPPPGEEWEERMLKKAKAKCPYCGKLVTLTKNRKFWRHNDPATHKRCVRTEPN